MKLPYLTILFALVISLVLPTEVFAATLFRPVNNLGLVGHWSFDEGTGSVVSSGAGGTSGSVSGAVWVAGKKSGALEFDGINDFVSVPHSADQLTTTGMTLSAWIRPDSIGETAGRVMHKSEGVNGLNGWQWYLGSPAKICITVNAGLDICSSDNSVPVNGEWKHVAVVVLTSGSVSHYVNGTLVGSGFSNPLSGITTTWPICIGNRSSVSSCNTDRTFDGSIDEPRVFGRSLSASEIAMLYGASSATRKVVSNDELLGHWSLDDATSTLAHDFSGNGRNMTVGNISLPSTASSGWGGGRKGGGLLLDGIDDFASLSALVPMDPGSGSYSASIWFKSSALNNGGLIKKKSNGAASSPGWKLGFRTSDANRFQLLTSDGSTQVESFYGLANVADGRWHHAVVVLDRVSNLQLLYVDGVLRDSDSIASLGSIVAPWDFQIGVDGLSYFNGSVDDARLYSRALSASEVLSLYGQSQAVLQSTQSNQVADGLVGYWSFNGKDVDWASMRALDGSGNSNHGAMSSMAATSSPVAGKAGQALNFTGANAINMPVSASLGNMTSAMSVSLWVKRGDNGTFRNIAGIMKNDSTTSYAWGFRANNSDQVFFDIFVSGVRRQVSDATVPIGTWVNYVFTFDGTNLILYRNGTSVNTIVQAGTIDPHDTKQFHVGEGGGYSRFVGSVDEVRVYNRTLSAAEAKQLYLLGK